MRVPGSSFSRLSVFLGLTLAGLAGAQTFYWNPSAPLLSGGGDVLKAYNWTDSANGKGSPPASIWDDNFSANTIGKTWTSLNTTGATGSAAISGGQLTLTGFGKDVWMADNQFVAVSRGDIAGNFDVTVKVVSQTSSSDVWAKAGLLMANDFANLPGGGYAMVAVTPGHGFTFQYDIAGNVGELDGEFHTDASPSSSYPCWLRLAKNGTSVTAYYRTSLANAWTQLGTAQAPLGTAANSQIAIFSTSHNAATASTAVFDDFTGGGALAAPAALDLSFSGASSTADSNARLTGNLSAKSIAFTGYTGTFDFKSSTLTLSGNADFSGSVAVAPGTGTLAFGAGTQTLTAHAGLVLPALAKSGSGTLALAGASVNAGLLTLSGGAVDLGSRNNEFAGLNATGGSMTGMDAGDTLTLSGNADFSGLTAFPSAGAVLLRAASSVLSFTPAAVPFHDLILWPRPLAGNAKIAVKAGSLDVRGSLVLRDEASGASGWSDSVDFRSGNPNVTVAGSLSRANAGSPGADSLRVLMGKGTWSVKGDVSLVFPAGLIADSATVDFKADAPAVQNLTLGSGSLGAIRHSGTGTLNLAQSAAVLKASSFSQSAGVLNLNGSDLSVADSIIVRNGAPGSLVGLGGRELKAGGDISLSGTSGSRLGLNPGSAWKATAGGALSADWADIGGSNAAGSAAAGAATANCVDFGGNTHWSFQPAPPSFVLQPASKEAVAGQAVTFKAKATGGTPIAYAWRKQGDTATLATADSLKFDRVDAAQNGAHYYCTATNSLGSVVSLDAVLTVDIPPAIDAQPADSIVVYGKPVSFTVAAHGTGPLTYAWRKTGAAAVLATTATLAFDSAAARLNDGNSFACTIKNAYDSVVSRAALLTVKYPPRIVRQPAATSTGTLGQKIALSVGATGTNPLSFAWTRAGDTAVLSRDSVLTLGPLAFSDTGSYQCRVTNAYGGATSQIAKLAVVQAATIVREPSDVTVGPGRKAVFIAAVAGAAPMTYAWRRKGDTAVIARDTILVLDSVKLAANGSVFVFTVSNAYGADTSREARLSVVACDSVFKVVPESLTVDEGQPVKLAGTAACAASRQWSPVSGPAPRILDPEVDTLAFAAPRVTADTVLVLRFSAQYGDAKVTKDVRIKVREAIPDPKFTLPATGKWKGARTFVVRPSVTNLAALKASPYAPPLRYLWSLSAPAADTVQAGDSLTLSKPTQGGNLDVTLCMDNGGASLCAVDTVNIDLASVGLARRAARFGPVTLSGRTLAWNADAAVRVWDFRGRILWQGSGRTGASAPLPEPAARDLLRGRARLEIVSAPN